MAEAGVGYVQDERYIAIEHMDVWRDCVSFARPIIGCCANRTQAAPAHPCARGIPFILNISAPHCQVEEPYRKLKTETGLTHQLNR